MDLIDVAKQELIEILKSEMLTDEKILAGHALMDYIRYEWFNRHIQVVVKEIH